MKVRALTLLVLSISIASLYVHGEDLEIPPPPTSLPPSPPPQILFQIVTSSLPESGTGDSVGENLSELGYFINSEISVISGTITPQIISGWIRFETVGWAYIPNHKKYDLALYLYSPEWGWLSFTLRIPTHKKFYSYQKNRNFEYREDEETGELYFKNENAVWEKLNF